MKNFIQTLILFFLVVLIISLLLGCEVDECHKSQAKTVCEETQYTTTCITELVCPEPL